MRATMVISGIAASLLAAGAAAKTPMSFSGENAAPLSPQGRANVAVQAGPVEFGEVLIQDMPTATDPWRDPKPVALVSNRGDAVARFTITISLEDDQGNVLAKGVRSAKLDEDTSNETFSVSLSGHLKAGEWEKVTTVRLAVSVNIKV